MYALFSFSSIILFGIISVTAQNRPSISNNRPRILVESNHFSNLKKLLNDTLEGREDVLFKEIDIELLTCNTYKH
jgi:hypothetical protein